MSNGELWNPIALPDFDQLVTKYGVADDLASKVKWLAELLWGEAPQAVVDETVVATTSTKSERALSKSLAILMSKAQHQLA